MSMRERFVEDVLAQMSQSGLYALRVHHTHDSDAPVEATMENILELGDCILEFRDRATSYRGWMRLALGNPPADAIPEPSATGLLVALVGAVFLRRRRV